MIGSDIFRRRRDELLNRIPDGSAVFLFAGKGRAMSQDTDYRFLPDRNFFYMTGLSYQDGKLILVREKDGSKKTILFALQRDELIERWHGKRMPYEDVARISGIDGNDIYDVHEFDERAYPFLTGYALYADGTSIAEESRKFIAEHDACDDLGPALTSMRMIKSKEEMDAICAAAVITEEALETLRPLVREGVTELELYTRLEYEMARRGSLIPAFETIVSIGTNAFYLHHSEPEDETGITARRGDIIQIDVGARCEGYCADISRVFFVGDCDDEEEQDRRQKLLGLIRVLRTRAFEFIKPGESFTTLNQEMRRIVGATLRSWGLLEEGYTDEDVKNYYWHNTGHHLGLDVHDICDRQMSFAEGNCLAIEPGVYIKEWGIGFRIEDDVAVTKDGCRLLSSGIDSDESIIIRGV